MVALPLAVLVIAIAFQALQTSALPTEKTANTCNGNICPYGVERRADSCRCCFKCEDVYHRVPLKHVNCAIKFSDCGDCLEGYTSKPIFGNSNQQYQFCKKVVVPPVPPPPPPPPTPLSWWPYVTGVVGCCLVLVVIGVAVVKFELIKKLQSRTPSRTPSREVDIALDEFARNSSVQGSRSVISEALISSPESSSFSSSKKPEENEFITSNYDSTAPLLGSVSTMPEIIPRRSLEAAGIQGAAPINLLEPNPCATFEHNNNLYQPPSAPHLSTTDSIISESEDRSADSGNYNSSSGNYSTASTLPIDQAERERMAADLGGNTEISCQIQGHITVVMQPST